MTSGAFQLSPSGLAFVESPGGARNTGVPPPRLNIVFLIEYADVRYPTIIYGSGGAVSYALDTTFLAGQQSTRATPGIDAFVYGCMKVPPQRRYVIPDGLDFPGNVLVNEISRNGVPILYGYDLRGTDIINAVQTIIGSQQPTGWGFSYRLGQSVDVRVAFGQFRAWALENFGAPFHESLFYIGWCRELGNLIAL